jgi:nucleoside-diphosphate-sugar epimerase
VRRFVYASSSSVYGIKDEENVTEDLALLPLTDYSKYKAMCEDVLMDKQEIGFTSLILRPATVCGYSPRLRLDLSVNILTNHAINKRGITVFGGQQVRPNIHIEDMTDLYVKTMEYPDAAIDGKIYNAGTDNKKIIDIATLTKNIVGQDVEIVTTETNDNRSYHISSKKISSELGFIPKRSVDDAVVDLVAAFGSGKIPQPLTDIRYYNIQTMQTAQLK